MAIITENSFILQLVRVLNTLKKLTGILETIR
jgi:hypothetical protein